MSNAIKVLQMPKFRQQYKKLHSNQKYYVDLAIKQIVENPMIGIQKRGDLSGVYIYKFDVIHQEMLLAYEWNEIERCLLALGVHENFYKNLKK